MNHEDLQPLIDIHERTVQMYKAEQVRNKEAILSTLEWVHKVIELQQLGGGKALEHLEAPEGWLREPLEGILNLLRTVEPSKKLDAAYADARMWEERTKYVLQLLPNAAVRDAIRTSTTHILAAERQRIVRAWLAHLPNAELLDPVIEQHTLSGIDLLKET